MKKGDKVKALVGFYKDKIGTIVNTVEFYWVVFDSNPAVMFNESQIAPADRFEIGDKVCCFYESRLGTIVSKANGEYCISFNGTKNYYWEHCLSEILKQPKNFVKGDIVHVNIKELEIYYPKRFKLIEIECTKEIGNLWIVKDFEGRNWRFFEVWLDKVDYYQELVDETKEIRWQL